LGLEIEERKEINCGNITHLEDTFKIIPFKKLQNNQLKEILENLLEVINKELNTKLEGLKKKKKTTR